MLFLSELGLKLKEARIQKGLSLEELQEITKIQLRYLIGIEEGNYSMMPGKFYARAFIKQYAEAVGLSADELFEEFKAEIPTNINDELPEKLSRVNSRKTMSSGNSKVFDVLPTILISIIVIGVLVMIWYFLVAKDSNNDDTSNEPTRNEAVYEESETVQEPESEEEQPTTEENSDEENTQEEEPVEETPKQEISVVESSGSTTTYELKNAEKFELKLVSTGTTWVNMQNGSGNSFFQGMLTKGGEESQTVDYTQETEANLVIGNTSETEIYVNDEKIEYEINPSSSVKQDIIIRYVTE